jgi:hypothetical protein
MDGLTKRFIPPQLLDVFNPHRGFFWAASNFGKAQVFLPQRKECLVHYASRMTTTVSEDKPENSAMFCT